MRVLGMRLAAVALALLAVVAVAEIGLRVTGYDPIGEVVGGRAGYVHLVPDRDLQYELIPDAVVERRRSQVRINSHGFRGRAVARDKPPGTERIVVIGDSITFAIALDEPERFTERLEQQLQAAGRPAEVLNLGVGGYDVLNEVAFLEARGLAFDPDLVIVAFCINDIGIHSVSLRTLRFLERYGWLTRRLRLAQLLVIRGEQLELQDEFVERNRDGVFAREHADRMTPVDGDAFVDDATAALEEHRRAAGGAMGPAGPHGLLGWYTSRPKLARLRYAFERLAAATSEANVPVLVAVIPFLEEDELAEAYRLAYDLVAHEAGRVGFDALVLRDAFEQHGFERARGSSVLHPNAEGHGVIAAALARHLLEGGGPAP